MGSMIWTEAPYRDGEYVTIYQGLDDDASILELWEWGVERRGFEWRVYKFMEIVSPLGGAPLPANWIG